MRTQAIAAFMLVAATSAPGLASDGKSALVGTWRYAGEIDTRADGSPAPAGALSDTQGLLIYSADGFMSVTLMPKARHWVIESASPEELRDTVGNGTAYAGRYEVDVKNHTITHITAVSMEPQFEGKRLVRGYVLDGNSLELTGTFPYQDQTIHFSIKWIRAEAAQNAK